jgi:hypothetical protein
MLLYLASSLAALLLLLLALKLSQRLTLRLKVLAGVTVSRQPQKSCPHLGMANDPFSHGVGPADEHRCYLYMQRDRIDLLHQKSFCLSPAHHKCPWLMIRRPDAPPPLRQRLRGALGGGFRPALGLAFSGLRRVPGLLAASGRPLWGGIGHAANGMDGIITNSARAIRHVGTDVGRALSFVVIRLGRAVAAVAADVWALTQRGNLAVVLLARGLRLLFRAVWWLARVPFRVLAAGSKAAWRAVAAYRRRAAERRAERATVETAAAASVDAGPHEAPPIDQALLAELFPGLVGGDTVAAPPQAEALGGHTVEAEPTIEPVAEPAFASESLEPRSEIEPAAEPAFASAASAEPAQVFTERLEAPLARFEELVSRLESLLSEGVAALDRGQDTLAYQLFLKATEQPVKLAEKAAPELRTQHTSLMTRAWFWRAKTAETVQEVVETLEQALKYEPDNLQIQAHLAWAKQRLEREQRVQEGTAAAAQVATAAQAPATGAHDATRALLRACGVAIRVVGGLMALLLAALWMTTGVFPALGAYLTQLPATDELIIRRLMLTVNATALPGQGHLPLPVLHYDLGLSLPFVMAFLFVFTARGLLDGDSWARTGALVLAGLGGWLCVRAVTNPDAGHLGLALCIGIIAAAVVGRFESPKDLPTSQYV